MRSVWPTSTSSAFAKNYPGIGVNVSRVGIFGHSLGGAAALSTILNNSRFVGGADFDGGFLSAPLTQTTTRPFLLWASSAHNQSNVPSWPSVWHNLEGWKLQLQLDGSTHGTFTDLPSLMKSLSLYTVPGATNVLARVLGTIDADKALVTVVEMVHSFFRFIFSNGEVPPVSVVNDASRLGDIAVVNGTNKGQ